MSVDTKPSVTAHKLSVNSYKLEEENNECLHAEFVDTYLTQFLPDFEKWNFV